MFDDHTMMVLLVAAPTSAANDIATPAKVRDEIALDQGKVQGIKVEESAAEKACRLLKELEQEGASLEESFKDASSNYLPDFDAVLPDFTKPSYSLLDIQSQEEMLNDLETLLPSYADDSPPMSPMDDLEELLHSHAQTLLPEETMDDASNFSLQPMHQQMPLTPSSSVASPGPSLGYLSPPYASSVCSDSSNDPEWVPEQQPLKDAAAKSVGGRGRRKPYSRAPTNRAERKKLQNKNAATRYRNKKKLEEEELFQVEAELMERNQQLKAKVAEAETEMRIVKDLLRSKFKRMGLLD